MADARELLTWRLWRVMSLGFEDWRDGGGVQEPDYFTWAPGTTGFEGLITASDPSAFIAERIMPCEVMPLS